MIDKVWSKRNSGASRYDKLEIFGPAGVFKYKEHSEEHEQEVEMF